MKFRAPVTGFDRGQLRGIRLLIMNETEAEALSGMRIVSFKKACSAGRLLLKDVIPQLIITLGSQGAVYMDGDGKIIRIPAYPVEAVEGMTALHPRSMRKGPLTCCPVCAMRELR